MKKLKSKIRMWFAEKLLSWASSVTPWDEEGQKIRRHISNYYIDKIEETLKKN